MIRKFFGDGERDFALTGKWIRELEDKTGVGIGELFRKLTAGNFRLIEITETIRLGMISAGTSPPDAARLVATYIGTEGNPLVEAHILALDVLTRLYVGEQKDVTDEAA